MERLTGRDTKLGFVDSNTLPSYVAIYKKLQEFENLLEDKEMISIEELPQKTGIENADPLSVNDFELRGFKRGWNACFEQIVNG